MKTVSPQSARQRGLSLLEMLVVVAIMSLVIAIGTQPLIRLYESVQFRATASRIATSIGQMRYEAVIARQQLVFPADFERMTPPGEDADLSGLPDGWQVAGADIVFLPTGVCLGGEVVISAPDGARSARYVFRAPACTPEQLQ